MWITKGVILEDIDDEVQEIINFVNKRQSAKSYKFPLSFLALMTLGGIFSTMVGGGGN